MGKVLSTVFTLFWLLLESDLFTYILSSCWALPRAPQQDGAELSPRFPGKTLILDL